MDFSLNRAKSIETDMKTINSSLELTFKLNRESRLAKNDSVSSLD